MRPIFTALSFSSVAFAAIGNYTVDPEQIDTSTRVNWCDSQFNTCNQLCNVGGGGTKTDRCEPSTLEYTCLCNNGTAPGLEYYEDSMEYNKCKYRYSLCIVDNEGSQADQALCDTEIGDTCGDIPVSEATAPEPTTTSESAATSTSASSSQEDEDSDSGAKSQLPQYANAAGAIAIGLFAYML